MALLSAANNSALNNATFDVKRNKILEMDKEQQQQEEVEEQEKLKQEKLKQEKVENNNLK